MKILAARKMAGDKKNLPMNCQEKKSISSTELPPKAVPFQVRPVTSWNGRVAISSPAPATPTTTLTPQPLWQASSAALCRHREMTRTQKSVHFLRMLCLSSPKLRVRKEVAGGTWLLFLYNGNQFFKKQ